MFFLYLKRALSIKHLVCVNSIVKVFAETFKSWSESLILYFVAFLSLKMSSRQFGTWGDVYESLIRAVSSVGLPKINGLDTF